MSFQPDNGDMVVPEDVQHELDVQELESEETEYYNGCPVWEGTEPHEYRVAITPTGRSLFKYCIYCDEMKLVDITKLA